MEGPGGSDAVGQVALGGRAEAGVGAADTEQRDVGLAQMSRMDGAGVRAKCAEFVEEFGGGAPVGSEALLVLGDLLGDMDMRSEEHTSELQSLMRISYAVFCLKKKK